MIKSGDMAVLRTKESIYCPCQIVMTNENNVVVTYLAGYKKDKSTGEIRPNHKIDTISRKEIVSISKRI
jgi:hypothetical protein